MTDLRNDSSPDGDDARPREEETPPAGVGAMAALRWFLVLAMAITAALSLAYSVGLVGAADAEAASTQYYCPMHPQVVQDGPGECPICSMSLVPKPSDGSKEAMGTDAPPSSHGGHRHEPSDPYFCPMHPEETGLDASARCPICKMKLEPRPTPPDVAPSPMGPTSTATSQRTVAPPAVTPPDTTSSEPSSSPLPPDVPGLVPLELTLDRVQLIGVRTAPATSEELQPELTAVGVVAADEARIARVHARFSGWIEQLGVATTGQKVRRGQTLLSIYSPELLPAQQEFIAAQRWTSNAAPTEATAAPTASLERDARARLELFGLSRAEIDAITKSGEPVRAIAVSAPIAGHVTRKTAVRGMFVQPDTELFEIADLSRVWVLVDIYERELARIALEQPATVSMTAYPNEHFSGKVGFIYPTVESATRTLRVRLELDNKDGKLRPGMYAEATILLSRASGVSIPTEALVDTGDHQYVFIDKGGGRFEPRRVRAGARSGERVQIVAGLSEGEVVVTTGNFLIDSESRLRAALQGTP